MVLKAVKTVWKGQSWVGGCVKRISVQQANSDRFAHVSNIHDKVNVGAAAGGVYMGMSRPFAEVEQEQ